MPRRSLRTFDASRESTSLETKAAGRSHEVASRCIPHASCPTPLRVVECAPRLQQGKRDGFLDLQSAQMKTKIEVSESKLEVPHSRDVLTEVSLVTEVRSSDSSLLEESSLIAEGADYSPRRLYREVVGLMI